jgi:hypothetical protein
MDDVEQSIIVYFDKDRRVCDPDDPDVATARRQTFKGGELIRVEVLIVKPPTQNKAPRVAFVGRG